MGEEQDHPIFLTDPSEWMNYVGKEVCVTVETGDSHTGWVYTVDPVSQSVALVRFNDTDNDDTVTLKVVMGHGIQSIVILDENSMKHKAELDALFKPREVLTASPEELKNQQDRLKSWLLKNRIPVEVSGDNSELLFISDALTIEPPYTKDSCRSTNQIILGRVQGLISNMPNDVEDW